MASPIAHMLFDTTVLPPASARDIWHDAMGQMYDVRPRDEADHFAARMGVWNIDGLLLTEGRFSGARFERSNRRIRADGFDHYTFVLHRQGRWLADTEGRSLTSEPGRVIALDFARPVMTDVGDNDSITLSLPRDVLDAVLPPFDMHGLALDGARGGLLHDFIVSLRGSACASDGPDAAELAQAIRHMLAACLSPSRDAVALARPQIDRVLLRRAAAHIDAHLHKPGWGGEHLRALLRVSRATMYRLFAPFGGVATCIRGRRLARAHMMLADPRNRRNVYDIAVSCGFLSDTSFSRAFREAFGYSPREARQVRPQVGTAASRDAGVVVDWIQRLRMPAAGGV